MKIYTSLYGISLVSLAAMVMFAGNVVAGDSTVSNSAPTTFVAPQGTPAATVAAPAPALAYSVAEVVKMYQGGIGKEVLVSYVETTAVPFHLTADAIIHLQHLGLPQEVTAAMIRRDGELQKQGGAAYQPTYANQPPYATYQPQAPQDSSANYQAPVASTAPPMAMPSTPPPVVNPYPDPGPSVVVAPPVVYPDYSVYPYYGYPYYYGPNVVIGGGCN